MSVILPKLQDVMESLKKEIVNALSQSNVPGTGQVYLGWPTGSEEVQKLGQNLPEGSITIYPIKFSQNATRYPWEPTVVSYPINNLKAFVFGNSVNFLGLNDVSYNIHGFVSGINLDFHYQTITGESLYVLAANYSKKINSYGVQGLFASSVGDMVTLSGAQFQVVNVVSSGSFAIEEFRVRRTLQVSLWINDIATRWLVIDALMTNIASNTNHFLALTDGSQAYIRFMADYMDDSSESSYSMYVHHIWYEVEYGQMLNANAYQIGGVEVTQEINGIAPGTTYTFGDT